MARKELVPAITHILNLSITTRTFPQKWKTAKIIPLWKGKDAVRTNPKSYRPVALLRIVSKILERVLHEQILTHMEKKTNFYIPIIMLIERPEAQRQQSYKCMTCGWKQ